MKPELVTVTVRHPGEAPHYALTLAGRVAVGKAWQALKEGHKPPAVVYQLGLKNVEQLQFLLALEDMEPAE